ncbi:hypothetical protein GUJ93_ZPchr0008g13867 [Zizania palustris]|uniref:Peptidase A1 domain-containing protein n=1 Tax=Zizania palustris TaxID=103762 RepID=A0A8J5VIW6_ZIZPA|nr:hypothetical protein GUJ93_ZPchr0008g13867 [Zizania palustris]
MKAAMASVLAVLIAVVSIAEQLCGCAASGGAGGFSVEFIHRDDARSPFHDAALTAHDRVLAAARRSTARAVALAARSSGGGTDDVVSNVVPGTFEYLMAVNIGTPPRAMLAIADTGSDLVWVKCKSSRYDASKALFDPFRSSTYGRVSCQSDACGALNDASCDEQSNCNYLYSYGDGSGTTGILSTETFTFVDGGDGARKKNLPVGVASVKFGCSTTTTGRFAADGLVGLGGGAVSLVTQLGDLTSLGRRFSYCLVPYSVNSSSALNFGALANVSEPGAVTTPLVASVMDTYYTVSLRSVKVGGKTVATSRSSPIIVDSGTTLTFIDPALLGPLTEELSRRITLPRAQSPVDILPLCYDVSGGRAEAAAGGETAIPDVTLEFGGGAAVTLRKDNAFVMPQEGTLCLALVATTELQPVSILGNIAQQNLHVGYDLDARTVTFAAANCAAANCAGAGASSSS